MNMGEPQYSKLSIGFDQLTLYRFDKLGQRTWGLKHRSMVTMMMMIDASPHCVRSVHRDVVTWIYNALVAWSSDPKRSTTLVSSSLRFRFDKRVSKLVKSLT